MKLSATVKEAVADAEVPISQEEDSEARPGAPRPRTDQDRRAEQPDIGQRSADLRPRIREFVAWYCSEPRLAFNWTVVLLRLESIQQREEHWVIADLLGKAGHVRTVLRSG
jgi:hypothetical protein